LCPVRANSISAQVLWGTTQHTFQCQKYSLLFGGAYFYQGYWFHRGPSAHLIFLTRIITMVWDIFWWRCRLFHSACCDFQCFWRCAKVAYFQQCIKCGSISCRSTFSGDQKTDLMKWFHRLHIWSHNKTPTYDIGKTRDHAACAVSQPIVHGIQEEVGRMVGTSSRQHGQGLLWGCWGQGWGCAESHECGPM